MVSNLRWIYKKTIMEFLIVFPGFNTFGHIFRRLMVLFEERPSKNFKVQKTNGGKFHLQLLPLEFHLFEKVGLKNLIDIESFRLWESLLQNDPLHYLTGKLWCSMASISCFKSNKLRSNKWIINIDIILHALRLETRYQMMIYSANN